MWHDIQMSRLYVPSLNYLRTNRKLAAWLGSLATAIDETQPCIMILVLPRSHGAIAGAVINISSPNIGDYDPCVKGWEGRLINTSDAPISDFKPHFPTCALCWHKTARPLSFLGHSCSLPLSSAKPFQKCTYCNRDVLLSLLLLHHSQLLPW